MDRTELLSFQEILTLVKNFAQLGVSKVRLTGGEPTVRKGFLDLVKQLKTIDGIREVHLTTNGLTLSQWAAPLAEAGLSGVNVSLDSLRRDRFVQVTKVDGLEQVLRGIDAAIAARIPTKVNMVVLPSLNEDEIYDFVEWVRDQPIEVRFIEFMPFLGNQWDFSQVVPTKLIRERLDRKYTLCPISDRSDSVAHMFQIPGWKGSIGFVSSISESFCSSCSRVRLTSDGQLKTCLFLAPALDLRSMLRSCSTHEEISGAIQLALQTKWKEHPPMNKWRQLDSLSMVQIGG